MSRAAALITVMAVCTVFLRALPFIVMPENRAVPAFITFLGRYLPPAMIGMLVIYCLKETDFSNPPYGSAELISVIAVIWLQKLKHNSLLSIGGGTLIYMILIRIMH